MTIVGEGDQETEVKSVVSETARGWNPTHNGGPSLLQKMGGVSRDIDRSVGQARRV